MCCLPYINKTIYPPVWRAVSFIKVWPTTHFLLHQTHNLPATLSKSVISENRPEIMEKCFFCTRGYMHVALLFNLYKGPYFKQISHQRIFFSFFEFLKSILCVFCVFYLVLLSRLVPGENGDCLWLPQLQKTEKQRMWANFPYICVFSAKSQSSGQWENSNCSSHMHCTA